EAGGDLPRGGAARRRPERDHRLRRNHGCGADRASGRRQDLLHRIDGGRAVDCKAAAGNLKRLTLELGGKSPLIMFDDANLDKAIMGAGMGLLAGSGQNCSCTSRIYVQRGIYDQVVEGLAAFAKMLPMGGSEDPNSVLGP